MNKDFGKERYTGRLVKVYRTMVSVGLMALLPIGLAAALLYALLMGDARWWHWMILSIGIIVSLYFAFTWLRHIGDRILIFEKGVLLTKAERRTKDNKREMARDEYIPWRDIRRFVRTKEWVTAGMSFRHVRRWIWIYTRGGNAYRISPDLYDTFFLEKKLRGWWSDGVKKDKESRRLS